MRRPFEKFSFPINDFPDCGDIIYFFSRHRYRCIGVKRCANEEFAIESEREIGEEDFFLFVITLRKLHEQ